MPSDSKEMVIIKHILLERGLTLHLLQTRIFKTNVVTVLLRDNLTRENATKNALLTGILRSGCEQFKTEAEIARECEDMYGAAFEASVLKKGEEHILQLYAETIKGEETFERLGRLLNCVLFKPLVSEGAFSKEYFEQSRERQRDVIAGRINDKRKYSLERCIEIMCKNERFGVSGDGCVSLLENETAESVYCHYERKLAENAIEICIIGDMGEDAAKSWALCHFGRQSSVITLPEASEIVAAQGELKEIKEQANVSQGKLVIGARCGAGQGINEFYALLLLNEILGGSAGSKFFKNIREKHSLCYYVNSLLYRAKSIMVIQAGIEPGDYERTLALIREQLKQTAEGEISGEELGNAKAALINQTEMLGDSPQGLTSFYMTNALLNDDTELSEVRGIIEGISKKDVSASAREIVLDTAYLLEGSGI